MNYNEYMPNFNNQFPQMMNPIIDNNIIYKINELETKIKKLEQRIIQLETSKNINNYNEPDNSLYMI